MKTDLPEEGLHRLERGMGYSFADRKWLRRALTHSSYACKGNASVVDNERLEFLGDAILGFLACRTLYFDYPSLSEGIMAKLKSYAVSETALAGYAADIGLGEYILLGKSELASGGRERPALLADAFEALTAAVFADGGLEAASTFAGPFMAARIAKGLKNGDYDDYKTVLQEKFQADAKITPSYRLISEDGSDRERAFVVGVYAGDALLGTGTGRSKKVAEQNAARKALESLDGEISY